MNVALRAVAIPDFGVPDAMPRIPAATYEARCRAAYAKAGRDWLVVYADREHLANMAFLTGFEPRFEEALLLLGPRDKRVLVVGNEGQGYTPVAGLPGLEIALSQTMSLMGQDRSVQPSLVAVLRDAGLKSNQSVGLVGWKYLDQAEWDGEAPAFFVPDFVVAMLARVAGGREAISDATSSLMHPTDGVRAVIDADQIALHEWGMARASAALWRIVAGARAGESELTAAARMGYAGEALTCHVMLASGDDKSPVIGLRGPTARPIAKGNGVTTALGYWGGLSCRAGLMAEQDDAFQKAAFGYFEGLAAWYATADIGVSGGVVFDTVKEALGRGGLHSMLNPGHLTGHDEWVHTPIRLGSTEKIVSGMPFQVDIIPVPMRDGWALNCEDGVVFADSALRAELHARHPAVYARIKARRAFMSDRIGVAPKESLLPLSNTPLCLPPFWLAADKLITRH